MAKKHYKAFKRQLEVTSPKGTFIPNSQKPKIFALGSILLGLFFLNGLFFGYLFGKKS